MALNFTKVSELSARVLADHDDHIRAMARVVAENIAKKLSDAVAGVDNRPEAKAQISGVKASRTASGGLTFSVTITQTVRVSEDNIGACRMRQAAIAKPSTPELIVMLRKV